jgi:hypothetical protein
VTTSHNQTYARWTWEKNSLTGHGRQLGVIEPTAGGKQMKKGDERKMEGRKQKADAGDN